MLGTSIGRALPLAALAALLACAAVPPARDVHFGSGKVEPSTTDDHLMIGRAVEALHRDRKLRLLLVGHTDSVGNDDDNRDLAFRRAARVEELITHDDAALGGRISTAYHGESTPVASNDTEEGRALNRRVEMFFYRPKLGVSDSEYLQAQFGGKLEFSASASAEVSIE